jgi:Xaa-Pro aminopeptidase
MSEQSLTREDDEQWPTLSEKERDRRWGRVREFLKKRGLDCLIVFDLQSREQLGKYLTNDVGGGIVVFPINGEMVHLVRNYFNVIANMLSHERGEPVWPRDVRAPAWSDSVVAILKEKGLEHGNIGVVGLYSQQAGSWEGQVPYKAWANILEKLPRAKFHEISVEYCKLMLVKSEEELRLVRRAAEIAEMASQAMLDEARPGIGENEIYAEAVKQLVLHGSTTSTDVYTSPMELHSGPDNPTWGPPKWMVRGQKPRIIQKGDIVTSEIFSIYGDYEAQAQMCIGIEPLEVANKECARIAREAYNVVVRNLAPGKKLSADVAEAAENLMKEAGVFHLTPQIHSLNPLIWVGTVATGGALINIPAMENYKKLDIVPEHAASGDLVIEPNMVFAIETNASIGRHRVNIGGTVIVKEKGVEELNKLATEMRVIS